MEKLFKHDYAEPNSGSQMSNEKYGLGWLSDKGRIEKGSSGRDADEEIGCRNISSWLRMMQDDAEREATGRQDMVQGWRTMLDEEYQRLLDAKDVVFLTIFLSDCQSVCLAMSLSQSLKKKCGVVQI